MRGLYIHIPFCLSKCPYCDFVSGIEPEPSLVDSYIRTLRKELSLYKDAEISTIYIGGGTPSLLKAKHLDMLFNKINTVFVVDKTAEITIEANPGDINKTIAAAWKTLGINRISLGLQSMDDKILRFLGRRNTVSDNIRAFGILQETGFDNISADFILSVRGADLDTELQALLALNPSHISAYNLTIEEGTLLYELERRRDYIPLTDEEYIANYARCSEILNQAGFIRYEISNFAREKKFYSRHNLNYWNYDDYIGAGLSASGFISIPDYDPVRYTNFSDFKSYARKIRNTEFPYKFSEKILPYVAGREFVMLGLRKTDGFSLDEFKQRFGVSLFDLINRKDFDKMSEFIAEDNGYILLTPDGINIADSIIISIWELME
jgi:oxygen-independent coproporphyrinogen-3 oxidase